jgi:RecA-family ATPase
MENTTALPEGVTMEKLLKIYEHHKKSIDARNEWYKTEEGRAYQRAWAKKYYDKHKDEILAKREARYAEKREELNEKSKSYYQRNKERILAKRKEQKLNAEA